LTEYVFTFPYLTDIGISGQINGDAVLSSYKKIKTLLDSVGFSARFVLPIFLLLICSSCAQQAAVPLGNDMMEIDISAAPVYGRAGAERMASTKAAETTLAMGYDKYMVMNNGGWNEITVGGGSQGTFSAAGGPAGASAFGQQSSAWGTMRHPEAKMIIKMYHYGDKGSSKAVDARAYLNSQGEDNSQGNSYPQ
jgi:hypothetical protein